MLCYLFRWSKIAEHLPGRTDNEIKNYWRTRVVKQAKQLKCDVNSKQFRDTLRFVWMPRMLERIQAQASSSGQVQTTLISNVQAHSDPCGGATAAATATATSSNPGFLSEASSAVDVHEPCLSDSCASYSLMGCGSWSSYGAEEGYSEMARFGGVDIWTDENIWFLQQQLADDFWRINSFQFNMLFHNSHHVVSKLKLQAPRYSSTVIRVKHVF